MRFVEVIRKCVTVLSVFSAGIMVGMALPAQDEMPAPLSAAHEKLAMKNGCGNCHETSGKLEMKRCLKCHQPIAESLEKARGYHGRLTDTECWTCHEEHRGKDAPLVTLDARTFDHTETGFVLTSAHTGLTCDQCHLGGKYLGNATGCRNCHESPHDADLTIPCAECHGASPKQVAGDFHGRKDMFALHSHLPCQQCHTQKTFMNMKPACVACHVDFHKGALGLDCYRCHRWVAWDVRRMDHSETGFPLMGAHLAVECGDCHRDLQTFRIVPHPSGCFDCHEKQFRSARFPHASYGAGTDCQECHVQDTWEYAHSPFWFNIQTGAHAGLDCRTCHKESGYHSYTCHECHQGHRDDNNGRCLDCHPQGFTQDDE